MFSEISTMAKVGELAGMGMTSCCFWKLPTIGLFTSNNFKTQNKSRRAKRQHVPKAIKLTGNAIFVMKLYLRHAAIDMFFSVMPPSKESSSILLYGHYGNHFNSLARSLNVIWAKKYDL